MGHIYEKCLLGSTFAVFVKFYNEILAFPAGTKNDCLFSSWINKLQISEKKLGYLNLDYPQKVEKWQIRDFMLHLGQNYCKNGKQIGVSLLLFIFYDI